MPAKKKKVGGKKPARKPIKRSFKFAATAAGDANFDLEDRVHLTEDMEYSDRVIKKGTCGKVVEVHELVGETWYAVFFDGDTQPKRLVPESNLAKGCP